MLELARAIAKFDARDLLLAIRGIKGIKMGRKERSERLERADHADIGAAEGFCEVWEEGSKGWLALVGRDGKKNKFDLFFDDFCLSFAARLLVVDVARGVV